MSTQTNVTVTEPIIRTLDEHEHVSLEWPDGRPGMVACAPELIDQMVQTHNERVDARLAIDAALALHSPECRSCGTRLDIDHPRCRCQELRDAEPVPVCGRCVESWTFESTEAWPCETARALGAEPLTLGGPAARSEP